MKCPYRKQTVHTERMYEFPADEELYMDCYEDECPFCGATAEINKYYPAFHRRVKVTVRCMKCRCNSGEWGRTDKAIEAWNRRTES